MARDDRGLRRTGRRAARPCLVRALLLLLALPAAAFVGCAPQPGPAPPRPAASAAPSGVPQTTAPPAGGRGTSGISTGSPSTGSPQASGSPAGAKPEAGAPAAGGPGAPGAPGGPASGVTVVGRGFGQPDDLALAPDGTIYFGDFTGGRIGSLRPGETSPRTVASGLASPEGLVVLPGGDLAVVEQGSNRIVRLDPHTGSISAIARLANPTRLEGVDGLGWDAAAGRLVVPDSPNGRLLLLDPASGRTRVVLAGGLGRPTGAVALPGGGYLVPDETGGRVLRIGGAAGTGRTQATTIARLTLPDDVVVAPSGAAYVNSLNGTVWQVRPVLRPVLRGLRDPQGLALGPAGTLFVAETGRNRILRFTPPGAGAPALRAPR